MTAAAGRIGPNALLQLAPVLERAGGVGLRETIFAAGGVQGLPGLDAMIPEGPVAAVHQALRARLPDRAAALAAEAGARTADYILANRIPKPAQTLLRVLPRALSAPLLAKAIARNAWTFAGSGGFRVVSTRPMVFAIADNPVVRGEVAGTPVCHWHSAVFRGLFAALVDPGTQVTETACCACGAPACRFEVTFR
jgi:divinyl protochlorophyllide a 8-vinyl-reductase